MTVCLSTNGVNVHRGSDAPTRLLVATLDGVQILERDGLGSAWKLVGQSLKGLHVSSMLIEPGSGTLFAGIHEGGVWVSSDDGLSWEERSEGITRKDVWSLRHSGRAGDFIYAGTSPVGLYRSNDQGRSWEELERLLDVPNQEKWTFPPPPHIPHAKTMAFDTRDPKLFYLGVEQGALLETKDGGASWREIESFARDDDEYYRDIHQIVLRPSNSDEIFMATGVGLYYSPDCGGSWEHLTDPSFRIGYPDQLIFSPEDDSTLFLSGAMHQPGTWRESHFASAAILRSKDSGRTWEQLGGDGLPLELHANIEAMSVSIRSGGFTLFAGTTDGDVFSSEDGGDSWACIASGLDPVSKAGHYRNLVLAK